MSEELSLMVIGQWAGKLALCEKIATGMLSHVGLASPTYANQDADLFRHNADLRAEADRPRQEEEDRVHTIIGRGFRFNNVRSQYDLVHLSAELCESIGCVLIVFPIVGQRAVPSFALVDQKIIDLVEKLFQSRIEAHPTEVSSATTGGIIRVSPPVILVGTTPDTGGVAEVHVKEDEIAALKDRRQLFGYCIVNTGADQLWAQGNDDFGLTLRNMMQEAETKHAPIREQRLLLKDQKAGRGRARSVLRRKGVAGDTLKKGLFRGLFSRKKKLAAQRKKDPLPSSARKQTSQSAPPVKRQHARSATVSGEMHVKDQPTPRHDPSDLSVRSLKDSDISAPGQHVAASTVGRASSAPTAPGRSDESSPENLDPVDAKVRRRRTKSFLIRIVEKPEDKVDRKEKTLRFREFARFGPKLALAREKARLKKVAKRARRKARKARRRARRRRKKRGAAADEEEEEGEVATLKDETTAAPKTRPRRQSICGVRQVNLKLVKEFRELHSPRKERGSPPTADALQQMGISPPSQQEHPLHYYAYYGNFGQLAKLSDEGADLNALDIYRRTPLHYAALMNNVLIVRKLLRRPDVKGNEPDQNGLTPLTIAALLGHADAVRMLLASGRALSRKPADPSEPYLPNLTFSDEMETVFREQRELEHKFVEAVQRDDRFAVMQLAPRVDVNANVHLDGRITTAITTACETRNNESMVHLLLDLQSFPSKGDLKAHPEYIILRRGRRRYLREQRIRELVQTEKIYYEDLQRINELFIRPLHRALVRLMPKKNVRDEFGSFSREYLKIFACHKRMRSKLQALIPKTSLQLPPSVASELVCRFRDFASRISASVSAFSPGGDSDIDPDALSDSKGWFVHQSISELFGMVYDIRNSYIDLTHSLARFLWFVEQPYGAELQQFLVEQGEKVPRPKVNKFRDILRGPQERLSKLFCLYKDIVKYSEGADLCYFSVKDKLKKLEEMMESISHSTGDVLAELNEEERVLEILKTKYSVAETQKVVGNGRAVVHCMDVSYLDLHTANPEYVEPDAPAGARKPKARRRRGRGRRGADVVEMEKMDLFVFNNCIVVGSEEQLQTFVATKTKVAWEWDDDGSFRLRVYKIEAPVCPKVFDRIVYNVPQFRAEFQRAERRRLRTTKRNTIELPEFGGFLKKGATREEWESSWKRTEEEDGDIERQVMQQVRVEKRRIQKAFHRKLEHSREAVQETINKQKDEIRRLNAKLRDQKRKHLREVHTLRSGRSGQ